MGWPPPPPERGGGKLAIPWADAQGRGFRRARLAGEGHASRAAADLPQAGGGEPQSSVQKNRTRLPHNGQTEANHIYTQQRGGDEEGTRVGGRPPSGEGGREAGDPLGRRPGPRFHEVVYDHKVRPYIQPCGSAVARQMYC